MISRGIIVGKIIDDLSMLEQQISIRNKLGQFDLTKICEDFFREILNIIYHKNLKNLNSERSNSPGLDLGDETAKIAFQITSQKGSSKVNETLNLINEDHLKQYSSIKILLIGKKQTTYKLNEKRCAEIKFTSEKNIIDITGLLKEIVVLNIDKLTTLFNIFKTEFRTVKIELEPVDDEGNFESSMHNLSEKKPNSPPVNAAKYLDKTDSNYTKEFKALIKLYNRLANIPKSTREIIFFIVDRGKYKDVFKNSGFRINPKNSRKSFQFFRE